ncbi:MAG: GNVR domain-containing protein, partial [Dehalococcoidia bacterium]
MEIKRVDLAAAQAERDQLMEALEKESPTLEHTRSTVSDEKVVEEVVEEEINPVYVFLKEKLSDAAAQTAASSARVTQLETKTEEFRATIKELSEKITEVEVVESTFDTEIASLTSNFKVLAGSLQEARLAKEEQSSSIRVVESAIVPRVPVGPNRQQFILPAAVSGLVIGVFIALLVHYVQTGSLRVDGSSPPRTREPVS